MAQVPTHLSDSVHNRIVEDTRPNLLAVYLKSGIAVFLGGVISLLICGQFGVAVTHIAQHLTNTLHHHTSDYTSAFACGIAFAFFPPFILRLLCSALQFRVLTRKSPHAALLWFVGFGVVLAQHGELGAELLTFALWSLTTVLTFCFVSRVIDSVASGVGTRTLLRH